VKLETGEILRFGKRVVCDNKVSNREILEDHLRQMREKRDKKRL
jgi:hypothetical protein